MYIIDKHKDYYDFHSHIYGTDKKVIYDRRGSIKLQDGDIVDLVFPGYFNSYSNDCDCFFLLEIGFFQYIFQIVNIFENKNYPFSENQYQGEIELVRVFEENKHRFNSPISIFKVNINYVSSEYLNGRIINKNYRFDRSFNDLIYEINPCSIENPILEKTSITKFIDSHKAWCALQNYISSLNNDKEVSIPMTEEEKAEQYGFDRKTSFRNPIK